MRRRRELQVHQLGSGSAGNMTALVGPQGTILVDAGFTARECLRRFAGAGLERQNLCAIVLTHAHLDHARGAALLSRRFGLPIWGTPWTLANLAGLRPGQEVRPLPADGSPVEIGGLPWAAHPAAHDIPGTVLLRVADRLGFATDLGPSRRPGPGLPERPGGTAPGVQPRPPHGDRRSLPVVPPTPDPLRSGPSLEPAGSTNSWAPPNSIPPEPPFGSAT